MLTFQPPELEKELASALKDVEARFRLSPDLLVAQDMILPTEDLDPNDYDDIVIEPDSPAVLELYRSEVKFQLTYSELLLFLREMLTATLIDNLECYSDIRFLRRVRIFSAPSAEASDLFFEFDGEMMKHSTEVEGKSVTCSLVRGTTMFGALVLAGDDYDKYFPPVLDSDLFVQVMHGGLPRSDASRVADAYMFELSASTGVDLVAEPRLSLSDREGPIESVEISSGRLRPLCVHPSFEELLRLHNEALGSQGNVAVIAWTKVVEYVSQTVVRQRVNAAAMTKLSSRKALQPDAQFIRDLEILFEENRSFRKDAEAIRLTIATCCDPMELASVAPHFLKIQRLNPSSTSEDRRTALENLGASIAATRNQVAHAKANYTLTGDECPPDELHQFVQCLRIAAQQVIRWFGAQAENARVT